ncbi:MAG: hypothetical protein ACLUNV_06250 [Sutterella wadsworthensis]
MRGRGAAPLLMRASSKARPRSRRGLILTCKERLIHYYEQFGFVNMGVSASEHGGAVWYDMTLEFWTASCWSITLSEDRGSRAEFL